MLKLKCCEYGIERMKARKREKEGTMKARKREGKK
jgi:hypothetical protein